MIMFHYPRVFPDQHLHACPWAPGHVALSSEAYQRSGRGHNCKHELPCLLSKQGWPKHVAGWFWNWIFQSFVLTFPTFEWPRMANMGWWSWWTFVFSIYLTYIYIYIHYIYIYIYIYTIYIYIHYIYIYTIYIYTLYTIYIYILPDIWWAQPPTRFHHQIEVGRTGEFPLDLQRSAGILRLAQFGALTCGPVRSQLLSLCQRVATHQRPV